MVLHRHEGSKAFLFRQGIGLGQLIGIAVGNADIADFAGLHLPVQALKNIVERCLVVPHMVDIQVHIVHAQMLQAQVQLPGDMLLTADPRLDFLLAAGQEFGRHIHLVSGGKIFQGPAQVLLAGAVLVGNGGIKEIYALCQSVFDNLPGCIFVHRPAMLSRSRIAKAHAAQADAGYFQITLAKFYIFHCHTPPKFTLCTVPQSQGTCPAPLLFSHTHK